MFKYYLSLGRIHEFSIFRCQRHNAVIPCKATAVIKDNKLHLIQAEHNHGTKVEKIKFEVFKLKSEIKDEVVKNPHEPLVNIYRRMIKDHPYANMISSKNMLCTMSHRRKRSSMNLTMIKDEIKDELNETLSQDEMDELDNTRDPLNLSSFENNDDDELFANDTINETVETAIKASVSNLINNDEKPNMKIKVGRRQSSAKKKLKCKLCEKIFVSMKTMKEHLRVYHFQDIYEVKKEIVENVEMEHQNSNQESTLDLARKLAHNILEDLKQNSNVQVIISKDVFEKSVHNALEKTLNEKEDTPNDDTNNSILTKIREIKEEFA